VERGFTVIAKHRRLDYHVAALPDGRLALIHLTYRMTKSPDPLYCDSFEALDRRSGEWSCPLPLGVAGGGCRRHLSRYASCVENSTAPTIGSQGVKQATRKVPLARRSQDCGTRCRIGDTLLVHVCCSVVRLLGHAASVRSPARVRDAVISDMPALRALYNALIPTTTVAWTEDLQTLRQRQAWFRAQTRAGYPVLVAEQDNRVVGFAAYASFRGSGKWPGYRHTVEHTIHVAEDRWGQGIGRVLIIALIERARADDVHAIVGAVDGANLESIAFHERLGFHIVARMPEVGRKFGRWLDLVLMQRIL